MNKQIIAVPTMGFVFALMRLATSEMKTTIPAVSRYLVIIQVMRTPLVAVTFLT